MPLPTPHDSQVCYLLQTVWDYVVSTGNWPTYGVIDRELYRTRGLDIVRLLDRTPESLLRRSQGGAGARTNDELQLTIAGVAACAGTDQAVEAFLRVVEAAVRAESEHDESTSKPAVAAHQLIPGASDGRWPATPEAAALARQLGLILATELGWVSSCQLYDGGWRIEVTREVRAFRGITSLEEYWDRVEDQRLTDDAVQAVLLAEAGQSRSLSQALERLRALHREAQSPAVQREGPRHNLWRGRVEATIARSLGPTSKSLAELRSINYYTNAYAGDPEESEQEHRHFAKQVRQAAAVVETAIHDLERHISKSTNRPPPVTAPSAGGPPPGASPSGERPPEKPPPTHRRVWGWIWEKTNHQVLGGLVLAALLGLPALLVSGDESGTATPAQPGDSVDTPSTTSTDSAMQRPNAAEAEADIGADGSPVLRDSRTEGQCHKVVPGALSTEEHEYMHDGIRIAVADTYYSAVSRTACAKLIKPTGSPYNGTETHLALTLCGDANQCDHDWHAYKTDAGPVVVPSRDGCISWRVSMLDLSGNWMVRDAVRESGCK